MILGTLTCLTSIAIAYPSVASRINEHYFLKPSTTTLIAQNQLRVQYIKSLDVADNKFFLHPNGQFLATLGDRLTVYDLKSGKVLHQVPNTQLGSLASQSSLGTAAISPDWKTMAINSVLGPLDIYKPETGERLYQMASIVRERNALVYGGKKSGQTFLAGQQDGDIQVIDAGKGKLLGLIKYGNTPVVEIVLDDNENRFLAVRYGVGGTIAVWDLLKGKKPFLVLPYGRDSDRGNSGVIGLSHSAISLSSDGSLLAVGFGNSDVIRVHSVKSGEILYEMPSLEGSGRIGVRSLRFSPDNRYLVSGHILGGFRLWDVKKQKLIYRFNGKTGSFADTVSQIEFNKGGNLLFTRNDLGIDIWKLLN